MQGIQVRRLAQFDLEKPTGAQRVGVGQIRIGTQSFIDLEDLAPHFLMQAARRNSIEKKRLSKTALEWLREQRWPGNVRQLRNVLEGASILADDKEILRKDLDASSPPLPGQVPGGGADWFAFATLDQFRDATEKEFIRRKLLENGGNVKRTAEKIELQRSNLYVKLDKYGLK